MHTAQLGPGGPSVGRIGLGCMGMSWGYDELGRDDDASIAVIQQAVDLGVTLIDTADQYGPYLNERLVGRALRGRRDEVTLATKGGLIVDGGRRTFRNGRPEHLRSACEASLLRLGVDHVDLYQLHRVDPEVPLEESWGALAELVAEGKVGAIGLSEVTVGELRRAQEIHPVATVQSELSLWTREALAEVVPYCERHGIAFVSFSPLGRGFLAGRIGSSEDLPVVDGRHTWSRFLPDAIDANQAIIDGVRSVADRVGATVAQVSLAWVLAQGSRVVAIPGTKTAKYLEENVGAAGTVLDAEALKLLDSLPEAVGSRF